MCKYKHLPKGWKVKKLGEISNIKTGKSNAVDADINGKYAFFDRSKKIKKSNRFLFDCESLIIPGEGAQFFPRYYSGKFDLHQRVYVIFNFHNSVHIRFVEYYLIFSHKYFEEVAVGATVKSLRLRHFTEIQIPFPSLSKQKFIVVTLNKTFAKITKAEAIAKTNLQNAKELFESYLNNVFEDKGDDWEEKTLGEVIEIRSGRNQKEVLNPNGKYPILGSAGKVMGYADKFLCVSGTTIIGRKGTINKPLFIKTNFWNVDTAFGLIASDKLTNEFLYYFCRSFNFKELDKGTTLPSLVKKDLIKITISFPKLKNEQKQIVQKLEQLQSQVKKLEVIYQQKITDLSELKKSILQKAFNGEL